VLQKGVVLLALAFVAGCGSSVPADKPEPVERHLVYQKLTGEFGIWIADVNGSRPRLLVRHGISPEISPDGKWVAYMDECRHAESPTCDRAYVVPTAGGKPRRLADGVFLMTWSPDSRRIFVDREEDAAGAPLTRIDVATGEEEEVTLPSGTVSDRSFSPDGKRMVFAVDTRKNPVGADRPDLFVAQSDGSEPERITDTGDSASPVWGPKSIAFARVLPDRGWDDSGEIWQIQPDGTGRTAITGPLPKRFLDEGSHGLIPIDWSDDGSALLVGWLNSWGSTPVAVDPGTGKISELGEWSVTVTATVGLSDDGRLVLVDTGEGAEAPIEKERILILPYAGGDPLLDLHGVSWPSWNR
jgi:hypothetical protein